jgi:hypothetical protein
MPPLRSPVVLHRGRAAAGAAGSRLLELDGKAPIGKGATAPAAPKMSLEASTAESVARAENQGFEEVDCIQLRWLGSAMRVWVESPVLSCWGAGGNGLGMPRQAQRHESRTPRSLLFMDSGLMCVILRQGEERDSRFKGRQPRSTSWRLSTVVQTSHRRRCTVSSQAMSYHHRPSYIISSYHAIAGHVMPSQAIIHHIIISCHRRPCHAITGHRRLGNAQPPCGGSCTGARARRMRREAA